MKFFKSLISDFKPHKMGLKKVLGDLEADIMGIIWKEGKATVRDVYEALRLQREIAYTTVMTIMGRLAEKNLLTKEPLGNAYVYTPTVSQEEFSKQVVSEVLDGLLEEFAEPAISHLVERISSEDENKIAELEKLIRERRSKGAK
ncbi:CopY family transcriptional repressor [Thermincola ferriacetica]|uniref:Transcriptional repressor, CopY family n=2 Tax=Thermincola TaxID=278993 RepID=D5X9D4_THEPJ|nr:MULTISPECIES: BlaI/MecI/CopY family transcriptional regulator [Thermincola]ADG83038.1 transcriptional repressor, CopY family [Thermincola potens JR]KNZ70504.1 CopY family transcriptional repressor [Thermincola ferriacetica]